MSTGDKSSPRASSRPRYLTCSAGSESSQSGEHALQYVEHEPRRLRAELDSALNESASPPLLPPTRREQCEERAARAYTVATNALPDWSENRYAREIDRCKRMHRDYRSGSRAVPADVVLMLPEQCQIVFVGEFCRGISKSSKALLVRELIRQIEESDDEGETARVA